MPCYGSLTPFPKRFGGGTPRAKVILESLNKARGTAYDTSWSSTVYLENLVAARAIAAAWSTNQRLAHVWDPSRMTGTTIRRWEKILALSAAPSDTEHQRRARIASVFLLAGIIGNHTKLTQLLSDALGSVFVAVEYVPLGSAVITVPDGSYPFGTPNPSNQWSSTVAHVLVRTQRPATYTENEYRDAVGLIPLVLDPVISAWATFDYYRAGPVSVPIVGGPSAAGFYLDDDHNLDFEIFDV